MPIPDYFCSQKFTAIECLPTCAVGVCVGVVVGCVRFVFVFIDFLYAVHPSKRFDVSSQQSHCSLLTPAAEHAPWADRKPPGSPTVSS
jgi:hypothetical protein